MAPYDPYEFNDTAIHLKPSMVLGALTDLRFNLLAGCWTIAARYNSTCMYLPKAQVARVALKTSVSGYLGGTLLVLQNANCLS